VQNYSNETVTGSVVVAMPGLYSGSVTMPATVEAGVSKPVTLSSTQFSELVIAQPSLWWPWQMGEQTMHQLEVSFVLAGSSLTSDALSVAFGIRQTESELTADGYRLYKVNKQPILIRAGGWAPDLFQRITPERQDIEFGCVWLCVYGCVYGCVYVCRRWFSGVSWFVVLNLVVCTATSVTWGSMPCVWRARCKMTTSSRQQTSTVC